MCFTDSYIQIDRKLAILYAAQRYAQTYNTKPQSSRLTIILIKIVRGLSLLSLGGAILDSTPHQKSPVFLFNDSSFDSPGIGHCLRNLQIIKNSFTKNKIKGGTQDWHCTRVPSGSFYLGLTVGLIVLFPDSQL